MSDAMEAAINRGYEQERMNEAVCGTDGKCSNCGKYQLRSGEVWVSDPRELCLCRMLPQPPAKLGGVFERTAAEEQFNVLASEIRQARTELKWQSEQIKETERLRSYTQELAVSMFGSLENRIMEQQRYGEALARLEQQLTALGERLEARFDEIDAQYWANCDRYDGISEQLMQLNKQIEESERERKLTDRFIALYTRLDRGVTMNPLDKAQLLDRLTPRQARKMWKAQWVEAKPAKPGRPGRGARGKR